MISRAARLATTVLTTVLTFLDFYSKNPHQPLRPRHRVDLVKFTRGFRHPYCETPYEGYWTENNMRTT